MGKLKIILAIISAFKGPKAAGGAIASTTAVGLYYLIMGQVDARQDMQMTHIQTNERKVEVIMSQQSETLATLRAISQSIDDMKENVRETKSQVKDTRDKVWQIGRDVYTLKNNSN